jgi:tetratricopeptide (TPR) repeat protein
MLRNVSYLNLLRDVLDIGQRNTLEMSNLLSNLGELREQEKKMNKAKQMYEQALQLRVQMLGESHPLVAETLEDIGATRMATGKYEKAEAVLQMALKIRRKVVDQLKSRQASTRDPMLFVDIEEARNKLAYTLVDVALAARKRGDMSRGRSYIDEALSLRRSIVYGQSPALLANVIFEIANTHISAKEYEESKPYLLECLRLRETFFGTDHRSVIEVLHILAHALDCLNEVEDAHKILEQAIQIHIRINQTENHEDVAATYSMLGMLYFQHQNFPMSIAYFKKSLEIWMKKRGIESHHVTDTMLNLAFALKNNNEVVESRNRYEQAAAILRRVHGYYHADVANVLASLSALDFYERKYEDALEYSKQVLNIRKKLFGRDHDDVISTVANQAVIYEKLLMNKNAHKLHLRVLQWRLKNLRNDNMLVAASQMAVSDSYRRLGDIPHAIKHNDQALELLRSQIGLMHETTIARIAVSGELLKVLGKYVEAEVQLRYAVDAFLSMSNNVVTPVSIPAIIQLASVARRLGRQKEAEKWYLAVLGTQEDLFGRHSVEVASTLSNLGVLELERFNLKEARKYLEESLATRQALLGERHPDVASAYNNMGSLLNAEGNFNDAKVRYEQALELRVNIFGSKHPSVAQSVNNIASLLNSMGKYDEAESLFRLAENILTRAFGDAHPELANTLSNTASCLDMKSEFTTSGPLHDKALGIRKNVFGATHITVAQSINNLGSSFLLQGKVKEAGAMYHDALMLKKRALGGDHNVEVAAGMGNQSSVLMAEGRYKVASELQRKAADIMEDILGSQHPYTVNMKGNLGISYRRIGEKNQGNVLLRKAAEYLQVHKYPSTHPWVSKFKSEEKQHGPFGDDDGSAGGMMIQRHASNETSTSDLGSGVASLRPQLGTDLDKDNLKPVDKKQPVRVKVEDVPVDDEEYTVNNQMLVSRDRNDSSDVESYGDDSHMSASVSNYSAHNSAVPVRRIVKPGKTKSDDDNNAALPMLPKILPKQDPSSRALELRSDSMDSAVESSDRFSGADVESLGGESFDYRPNEQPAELNISRVVAPKRGDFGENVASINPRKLPPRETSVGSISSPAGGEHNHSASAPSPRRSDSPPAIPPPSHASVMLGVGPDDDDLPSPPRSAAHNRAAPQVQLGGGPDSSSDDEGQRALIAAKNRSRDQYL